MNPSTRSEVLPETDHVQEHRGNPGVDTVPPGLCSDEQTLSRNPVGPYVPDEADFETFVGGAGI
jgi:hypothetical protein